MNRAKKSLGQHFLTSKQAVFDALRGGNLNKSDTVLEIGPGKGFLTEELLKTAGKVIAIEKDEELVLFLQEKFKTEVKEGKLVLVNEDIRNFQPQKCGLSTGEYKIIANIPYYITGEIFRQFLESEVQPFLMILMIQKEVGERIMARNNKESLLSLSVKAYGTPQIVRKVGRGSFNPPPNVDSVLISIRDISKKSFKNVSEKAFFELIHLGFAHKRKQMMGNLKEKYSTDVLEKAFSNLRLDFKIRAEDLPLSHWFLLVKNLSEEKITL